MKQKRKRGQIWTSFVHKYLLWIHVHICWRIIQLHDLYYKAHTVYINTILLSDRTPWVDRTTKRTTSSSCKWLLLMSIYCLPFVDEVIQISYKEEGHSILLRQSTCITDSPHTICEHPFKRGLYHAAMKLDSSRGDI